MVIDNKFDLEQEVYLKTDSDQLKRIVTAISVHPNKQIIYSLTCCTDCSDHYDFEISDEENTLTKVK